MQVSRQLHTVLSLLDLDFPYMCYAYAGSTALLVLAAMLNSYLLIPHLLAHRSSAITLKAAAVKSRVLT